MKEIKIDLRELGDEINERFINKDLITFEELLGDYEELIFENKELLEKLKDKEIEEQDRYEEYKLGLI